MNLIKRELKVKRDGNLNEDKHRMNLIKRELKVT